MGSVEKYARCTKAQLGVFVTNNDKAVKLNGERMVICAHEPVQVSGYQIYAVKLSAAMAENYPDADEEAQKMVDSLCWGDTPPC